MVNELDPMYMDLREWEKWYPEGSEVMPFGHSATYAIGAEWLSGLDVEDWGCGYGWFKTLHHGGYKGIDGVHTGHEDLIADLCTYRSNTQGIFMRGVMEYNEDWRSILKNCVMSATERIALVVTTPEGDADILNQIGHVENVPRIVSEWTEITRTLKEYGWTGQFTIISSDEFFYSEGLWLAERSNNVL